MVKPDRYTSRRDEYGHPITMNQGAGMIDLESVATIQLDGENVKRRALRQTLQNPFKVLRRHSSTPLTWNPIELVKTAFGISIC